MKKHPRHKHGGATGGKSRLYNAWRAMRARCFQPSSTRYQHYGGRGIKICEQWSDFAKFAADVGPHPGKGWSLDRINTDGDYEPSNVRWASHTTQARNRRNCKLTPEAAEEIRRLYATGEYRQIDLAERFDYPQCGISQIIRGVSWK